MTIVPKSGCPVLGQTAVNSGQVISISYSRSGNWFGNVSSDSGIDAVPGRGGSRKSSGVRVPHYKGMLPAEKGRAPPSSDQEKGEAKKKKRGDPAGAEDPPEPVDPARFRLHLVADLLDEPDRRHGD